MTFHQQNAFKNLLIIGLNNGLSQYRQHAIIETNDANILQYLALPGFKELTNSIRTD